MKTSVCRQRQANSTLNMQLHYASAASMRKFEIVILHTIIRRFLQKKINATTAVYVFVYILANVNRSTVETAANTDHLSDLSTLKSWCTTPMIGRIISNALMANRNAGTDRIAVVISPHYHSHDWEWKRETLERTTISWKQNYWKQFRTFDNAGLYLDRRFIYSSKVKR